MKSVSLGVKKVFVRLIRMIIASVFVRAASGSEVSLVYPALRVRARFPSRTTAACQSLRLRSGQDPSPRERLYHLGALWIDPTPCVI
jgi:hypothetical protein